MTKSELRKARKEAKASGRKLDGELTIPGSDQAPTSHTFTATRRGERALYRWARRYDDLNGAPESDYDR